MIVRKERVDVSVAFPTEIALVGLGARSFVARHAPFVRRNSKRDPPRGSMEILADANG